MLRHFSHYQLCQWYVLCRCVSTGSYAQCISCWFMNNLLSAALLASADLGWNQPAHCCYFYSWTCDHNSCSRCWRNTELRKSLPQNLSIGAGIKKGLDVGGWWRWAVNGKSVGIATSWVDNGGPRLGLPGKRCCRTKDIRGKSLNSSLIVWVVRKVTSGLRDPENGERNLSWGWHPGCQLKWW